MHFAIPRSAPSDTSRLKTFCLPDDETRAYLVRAKELHAAKFNFEVMERMSPKLQKSMAMHLVGRTLGKLTFLVSFAKKSGPLQDELQDELDTFNHEICIHFHPILFDVWTAIVRGWQVVEDI